MLHIFLVESFLFTIWIMGKIGIDNIGISHFMFSPHIGIECNLLYHIYPIWAVKLNIERMKFIFHQWITALIY